MAEKTKRELILEAATKVFAQHGFHLAKMEDIASTAGVGKGTVYEYFPSKQELFQEMVKNNISMFMESAGAEVAKETTAKGRLTRVAYTHLQFVLSNKDFTIMSAKDNIHFDGEFRKWMRSFQADKIKGVEEIIKQGIATGEFRACNTYAVALTYFGGISMVFAPLMFGETIEREAIEPVLNDVLEVIFSGLTSETF